MSIVAFWSDKKKETAQTLSMIAIASYMAVENNSKILMIDTNLNDRTIQNAYFGMEEGNIRKTVKELNKGKMDLGGGIDGLSKLIASGKNSGDIIPDYSQVIFKGRLEAILSFQSNVPDDIQRVMKAYKDLIKMASQVYDYVFIDLQKGQNNPFVEEILQIAQVVVYNITQRQLDIDDYLKMRENHPVLKTERVLPLIGRYDRFSKYSKKNIARAIGEKKEIPAISYNTLFFESANDGEMGGFFLKYRKSLMSASDRNNAFVDEVKNAAERLVYKSQEVLLLRQL